VSNIENIKEVVYEIMKTPMIDLIKQSFKLKFMNWLVWYFPAIGCEKDKSNCGLIYNLFF
jgi:hypothetical protein